MPTLSQVPVEATVDVDFDIVCTCGYDLGSDADMRDATRRSGVMIRVPVCKDCLASEVSPLNDRIKELEDELAKCRRKRVRAM